MARTREFLDDRVCVVTGANTGIGLEIARGLALMRARVVLACRSEARGQEALRDIIEDTCNDRVSLLTVDLSSQRSIRAFADRLATEHPQVHVLVNNAAVWMDERKETDEGVEMTWATNVLGPFLLTNQLLGALKGGAPARVVNVASKMAYGLDLDDVEYRRRSYRGTSAYAQSKQALRMLTWAWDTRHEGSRVTFNAVHPGVVSTEIARNGKGLLGALSRPFFSLFGRTPQQGADTALWVATADENERSSGNFWVKRKITPCPFRDAAAIDRLWSVCESMTQKA